MSSLYMLEQVVDFSNNQPLYSGFLNKLQTKASVSFPSNIINCSLTVKEFVFSAANFEKSVPDKTDVGDFPINSLGWGVENISYMGNQVFFSGWMQLLYFKEKNEAIPEPHNSYLTILAIAQCE